LQQWTGTARPGSDRSAQDLGGDGGEVGDAAGKHEQMPDGVAEGQAIEMVDHRANGEEHPAGDQQGQGGGRQGLAQRGEGDHHQPAHADVGQGRQGLEAAGEEQLEDDAEHGQAPDDTEQGPAPAAADGGDGEGRVGGRDHQEDRAVVEHLQAGFEPGVAGRVIQGGGRVEQDQGGREDDHADNLAGTGVDARQGDQHGTAADGQDHADAVGNGVGDLFAMALGSRHGPEYSTPALPGHESGRNAKALHFRVRCSAEPRFHWKNPMLRLALLLLASLVLIACSEAPPPPPEASRTETEVAVETAMPVEPVAAELPAFEEFTEALIERMLAHSPEWAVYQGRYEQADVVTIPDAARRELDLSMIDTALSDLALYRDTGLTPAEQADYALLDNRLRALRWYQTDYRGWQWNPASYNVAGVINVILNTDFAPLPERLDIVRSRLQRVPAYYEAAKGNIERPTMEHLELAIVQNQGGLRSLGEGLEARLDEAEMSDEGRAGFMAALTPARAAIEDYISFLEAMQAELAESGEVRPFRLGAALYEPKFAFDIQAGFTGRELYERALAEKGRLLTDMDEIAVSLWAKYFPEREMPEDRLVRIGDLIDHLSDRHTSVEEFIPEIRRQIPALEAFVRDKDLMFQDPDKPLIVRETPEYMRGGGAIASVSAPGPFNPAAETYYNVTPLETYGEEQAASYLREYNHWILQILNIHEAIPGHYTQLLHANLSPSLVKSLFGNGAMIEGWAVYAERMMLEAGWGDNEPEMWLMYGKWALRVVHNAILDYAVHVEGMERDEAIRLMREEAFQEESEATQKWRRLTLSQVQLTSYFSGYAEIYDYRERVKAELGEDFDLADFHNQFLSYGSAPVSVIAGLMDGARVDVN